MKLNVHPLTPQSCADPKEEEHISTAAISSNGSYLLIATLSHCKLFQLIPDTATLHVTVKELGTFPHGARLARFTHEGNTIILVTPDSEIQIHPFLEPNGNLLRFDTPDDLKYTYINKLAISPDSRHFATSTSSSVVRIQTFASDVAAVCLPRPSSAITALAFLTSDVLALTLAENNHLLLFERHGTSWDLHPWCHDAENIPSKIRGVMDKCQGIFVVNGEMDRVWLWGANWVAWIKPNDKKVPMTPKSKDKSQKQDENEVEVGKVEVETPHWISYRYREVLLMECLGSGEESMELVAVERPRHEILEDITEPRFYRHEYGT
jgi:hypothetical protein